MKKETKTRTEGLVSYYMFPFGKFGLLRPYHECILILSSPAIVIILLIEVLLGIPKPPFIVFLIGLVFVYVLLPAILAYLPDKDNKRATRAVAVTLNNPGWLFIDWVDRQVVTYGRWFFKC